MATAWNNEWAVEKAAVACDADAYLEALRGYCRAGRRAAMQARKGGAVSICPQPHQPHGSQ